MTCRKTTRANDDKLAIRHPRWLCKKPKFKARESRGVRRTCRTPQRQRDEAQRRNWVFHEVINDDVLSPIPEAARHGKPADLGGMAPLPEKGERAPTIVCVPAAFGYNMSDDLGG
jgi:hypothetical protein